MRIEVPAWAVQSADSGNRLLARFGSHLAVGERWAVHGLGTVHPLTDRIRYQYSRGGPAHPVAELVDGDLVLARARLAVTRESDHRKQLLRAVPSLCEQVAFCLMSGQSLPDRPELATTTEEPDSKVRTLIRRMRVAPCARDWSVLLLDESPGAVFSQAGPLETVSVSPPYGIDFWADPFLLKDDEGTTWLFVESMNRWTGKGEIVAGHIDAGRIRGLRSVLKTAHTAFPRIIRVNGRYLATAESLTAVNPVYTFDRPGQRWRPIEDWNLPAHTVDPVLLGTEHGGFSLYGTDRRVCSAGAVVSYTSRGVGQPWHRAEVPFMYDVVAGRSAGGVEGGLRVTQDCSGSYGWRVHQTPVSGLDASLESLELPLSTLRTVESIQGMHTLNGIPGGPTVVDTWRHRADPRALWWRLTERLGLRA